MVVNVQEVSDEQVKNFLQETFDYEGISKGMDVLFSRFGDMPELQKVVSLQKLLQSICDLTLNKLQLFDEFRITGFTIFQPEKLPRTKAEFQHAMNVVCTRSLVAMKEMHMEAEKAVNSGMPAESIKIFDSRDSADIAGTQEGTPPDIAFAVRMLGPQRLIKDRRIIAINLDFPGRAN